MPSPSAIRNTIAEIHKYLDERWPAWEKLGLPEGLRLEMPIGTFYSFVQAPEMWKYTDGMTTVESLEKLLGLPVVLNHTMLPKSWRIVKITEEVHWSGVLAA